jgi:hypothetical protein
MVYSSKTTRVTKCRSLGREGTQRGCKVLIELVLVFPVRICSGVAEILGSGKGVQEPAVAEGSAGAVTCHVRGRNQQPRKDRSLHNTDLPSPPPKLKEGGSHDVFSIVVIPAEPVCVAEDPVVMPVVQGAKGISLAQKALAPQPLFAVSVVPHDL